jgi:hypothetical protein
MRRRALLLSGGISREQDRLRYANDVAAYHRLLVETYGYGAEDVRICAGPGSARPLVAGGKSGLATAATRKNVLESLAWLAELEAGDLAFLMVTDHGDPDGMSLWGKGRFISPAELTAALRPSAATKVLVFGQCHAGIFGAGDYGPAVVCCACAADGSSYPRPRPAPGVEALHNEFLYQFAGALQGVYPDGLALPGGDLAAPPRVSVGDAFRFAFAHDCWTTGTRQFDELPRLFDPAGLADGITL